jgi:hypothetical protein
METSQPPVIPPATWLMLATDGMQVNFRTTLHVNETRLIKANRTLHFTLTVL